MKSESEIKQKIVQIQKMYDEFPEEFEAGQLYILEWILARSVCAPTLIFSCSQRGYSQLTESCTATHVQKTK